MATVRSAASRSQTLPDSQRTQAAVRLAPERAVQVRVSGSAITAEAARRTKAAPSDLVPIGIRITGLNMP